MKWTVLAAVAAVGLAGPVAGMTTDGNYLYGTCENNDPIPQGYCIGFITGVIEGMRFGFAIPMMLSGDIPADEVNDISDMVMMNCPPPTAAKGQYVGIVINYLRDNPATRHHPARLLILQSLQEAFPCPDA